MKPTLREATDGEFTVYYTIDSDGGKVEAQDVTLTLEFWELSNVNRKRAQRIAEADSDRHEREMRGGETP